MALIHKSCGGEVMEDHCVHYDYEREDGSVENVPALRCAKCGTEIEGDFQLENIDGTSVWEPGDAENSVRD